MSEKTSCLLPTSVVPTNYTVRLRPNLEKFTFEGKVSIDVNIGEPVREITLHAAELEIKASDVFVLCDTLGPISPQEVRFDEEAETATFMFAEELPVGRAYLDIAYTGTLNDNMAGFYRSKYTTETGETKHLATTQFEATDARRALPCWDEPARKATFDVRLVVPKNLVALSNMPMKSTEAFGNDLKVVSFERTPVMSTYLLAFVVGEFEFVETNTNNGTLIRVYTMLGKSEQGRFALDVGRRSIELYNDYFDTPYPLPKLDMIAIPDFAAGAMENWGLVTYRENALLIDQTSSSAAGKQRVAEVVAHELAHQWFGNLVTMKWWTNLWLNEGFATWMANFALDHLFPEWDIWTQFLPEEYASALSLDSLRSSHPIEVPVNNPDEISQIFDAISYSKGAGVIRMIHDSIGVEAFRAGLRIYLKRYAYGNAVTEDLWQALAEASGAPVREIMDTWTKQAGYPLIRVLRRDDNTCVLLQQRFLASGAALTELEAAQEWQIPIASEFRRETGKSEYQKNVFGTRATTISAQGLNFLKLNSGQIVLARVNYLPEQWQALAEAIRRGQLEPADRYGIVSDALSLARAGHLSTVQLISLLLSYENEEDYTVWTAVLGALGALGNILVETPEQPWFASFTKATLMPIVEKLGWEGTPSETHLTKLLRGQVLAAMAGSGDDDIIAEANVRFYDYAVDLRPLHPNLRSAVYGTVAKYGEDVEFNKMVELYRKETFQEEKVRLLSAMGQFSKMFLIPAALNFVFNSGEVRPGDAFYALSSMGSHANGRRAAWKFLVDNWKMIDERYSGGGLKMLARIISATCNSFTRAEDADVIEQFFSAHPAPSATRAIAEAVERIRVNAAWYQRDKDAIVAALKLK